MDASKQKRQSEPPALVPELLVGALQTSLAFWGGVCGFDVLYDRVNEGFAYLVRDSAHLMLEEAGIGRNWLTGALDRPLGRGINLQISVPSIIPIVQEPDRAQWPLSMRPEVRTYRIGDGDAHVSQFLVQDPDGYLIRFQASIAQR